MRKAIIYVFTGTGNTRAAADEIAGALEERGIETTVWEARVPFSSAPDPNEYDIAGFGYPIHAFNTPQFFLRFARTLPQASGKPAFIFKTSGEPFHLNSASSWPLVRILRQKGFIPTMDKHLLMPYNIMFRYDNALAKQMYLHTCGMAGVIAKDAAAGISNKLRYYPWTIILMYIFRLQWFGAWINGPFIHADRTRCSGCGRCAAQCPAQNVRLKNGMPHFSDRCTMCMRCVFNCPKDALRPGFLNAWRVNGAYPFEALVRDESVPAAYVSESTRGYFRLFLPYYLRTGAEIDALRERESPR